MKRVGVTDTVESMRWGRCLWQQGLDGSRRHLLVLVSERGDSVEQASGWNGLSQLHEPRLTNIGKIAMYAREVADLLIAELQSSGVISVESGERVQLQAHAAWERRFRDFHETRDLKQFH